MLQKLDLCEDGIRWGQESGIERDKKWRVYRGVAMLNIRSLIRETVDNIHFLTRGVIYKQEAITA